jgi:hypothetical protein
LTKNVTFDCLYVATFFGFFAKCGQKNGEFPVKQIFGINSILHIKFVLNHIIGPLETIQLQMSSCVHEAMSRISAIFKKLVLFKNNVLMSFLCLNSGNV